MNPFIRNILKDVNTLYDSGIEYSFNGFSHLLCL